MFRFRTRAVAFSLSAAATAHVRRGCATASPATEGGDTAAAADGAAGVSGYENISPARVVAVAHNYMLKDQKGHRASKKVLEAVDAHLPNLPTLLLARVAVTKWPEDSFSPELEKKIRRHVYASSGDLTGTQVAQLFIVWGLRQSHSRDLGVFQKLGLLLQYHINHIKDPELIIGVLRTLTKLNLCPPTDLVSLCARRLVAFDRANPFSPARAMQAMIFLRRLDALTSQTAAIFIGRVIDHVEHAKLFVKKNRTTELAAKDEETGEKVESDSQKMLTMAEARQVLSHCDLTLSKLMSFLKLMGAFSVAKRSGVENITDVLMPFLAKVKRSVLVGELQPLMRILNRKVRPAFMQEYLDNFVRQAQSCTMEDLSYSLKLVMLYQYVPTERQTRSLPPDEKDSKKTGRPPLEVQIRENVRLNVIPLCELVIERLTLKNPEAPAPHPRATTQCLGMLLRLAEDNDVIKQKLDEAAPAIFERAVLLTEKGCLPLFHCARMIEYAAKFPDIPSVKESAAKVDALYQEYSATPDAMNRYRKLIPVPRTYHAVLGLNRKAYFGSDISKAPAKVQMLKNLYRHLVDKQPSGLLQMLQTIDVAFPHALQPRIRAVFARAILSRLHETNVPDNRDFIDNKKDRAADASEEEQEDVEAKDAADAGAKDAKEDGEPKKRLKWAEMNEEQREEAKAAKLEWLKRRRTLRIYSPEHLLQLVKLINSTSSPRVVKTNPRVWDAIAKYAKLHRLEALEKEARSSAEIYRVGWEESPKAEEEK